jgi:deoxyribonuclease V
MNIFEYTYGLVRQIPGGRVSSYGAVAKALGDIRASRAVGRMMNQNPDPDSMPCYKIVYSDGRLGGFGRGIADKIRRLKKDNILVKNGHIVDFKKIFFDNFVTNYPLKKLRQEQIALSKKVDLKNDFTRIESVAGIDIAYPNNEFDDASGACIVMDYKTKQIIDEHSVFAKTTFPYISTYLSYRELSVVQKLIECLTSKPTALLIDGNGILHPYCFGFASHVGVVYDIPTIGIAKSLLYGHVEDTVVKIHNDKKGYAVFSSPRATKPIYVSPGHCISFQTSLDIVHHLSRYKIPEPLRQAHILAKRNLLSQVR